MDDNRIKITRTFNAPLEKVWEAWTNPETMKKWYSPDYMTTPDVSSDLTVGGSYSIHMHADQGPDGKPMDVTAVGKYKEIEENKKLVFTWRWDGSPEEESMVTVEMEEEGDSKTKLTLTHDGLRETNGEHTKGWESTFDNLDKYLG